MRLTISFTISLSQDLSFNLGVPEDFAHPRFQSALRTIFGKARAAGVGAAIHQGVSPTTRGMTPSDATRWIAEFGCNVYIHAADMSLFATQLTADLKQIRAASGCDRADVLSREEAEGLGEGGLGGPSQGAAKRRKAADGAPRAV